MVSDYVFVKDYIAYNKGFNLFRHYSSLHRKFWYLIVIIIICPWTYQKKLLYALVKVFLQLSCWTFRHLSLMHNIKDLLSKNYFWNLCKTLRYTLTLSMYNSGAIIFLWWAQIAPFDDRMPWPRSGPRSLDR